MLSSYPKLQLQDALSVLVVEEAATYLAPKAPLGEDSTTCPAEHRSCRKARESSLLIGYLLPSL